MVIVPNSFGSWLREFNRCHDDAGKFCSRTAGALPRVSAKEGVLQAGTRNIFTVEDREVRRFLYNPDTNEMILGQIAQGDHIWDVPYHADLLDKHKGREAATSGYDAWVRGYLYGGDYGMIHVESLGAGYPYNTELAAKHFIATVIALRDSGAGTNNNVNHGARLPGVESTVRFGKLLQQLHMGHPQRRSRAA